MYIAFGYSSGQNSVVIGFVRIAFHMAMSPQQESLAVEQIAFRYSIGLDAGRVEDMNMTDIVESSGVGCRKAAGAGSGKAVARIASGTRTADSEESGV